MKKIRLFLISLLLSIPGIISGQINHPGILFNTVDLNRMKTRLHVQPWKGGYEQLLRQYQDYVVKPAYVEVGREPDVNRAQYEADMAAVLNLSILWYMTHEVTYAQKATSIINNWSTTHTIWSGTTWSGLLRGDFGTSLATGAEILRYTYPGWTATNTTNCSNYLLNMYWTPGGTRTDPVTDDLGTGNQGLGIVKGLLAVAIFLDDQAKIDYILNVFKLNQCVSMARLSLASGQNAEAGRDQAHTMIEIQFMADIAEIASNQGLDIYSLLDNRILSMHEYWSKYNLGLEVPYTSFSPCYNNPWGTISQIDRGKYIPGSLDLVYSHYVLDQGLSAPFSDQLRKLAPVSPTTFLFRKDPIPNTPEPPLGVTTGIGYKEVIVSWAEVLGAVSYNVKRSTTSGGPFMPLATAIERPVYVDTAVSNGTAYFYAVSANGINESANSDEVYAKPQELSLTNQNIGITNPLGTSTVNNGVWSVTGAGSDVGTPAEQFNYAFKPMRGNGGITARLNSGSQGKIGIMIRNSTVSLSQFVFLFVENGGAVRLGYRKNPGDANVYYAGNVTAPIPRWIRLERNGYNYSGYTSSNGVDWILVGTVSVPMDQTPCAGLVVCGRGSVLRTGVFTDVTIKGTASTPTGLSGSYVSATENELKWEAAPDAMLYQVYRSLTSGGPYARVGSPIGSLNYRDTGLTPNTYYYVITSSNPYGESARSLEIALLAKPVAPTLKATPANGQVVLTWNAVPNASTYNIKRLSPNSIDYIVLANQSATVYMDKNLVNDSTYTYIITAQNSTGEGLNSNQATATPSTASIAALNWTAATSGAWDMATVNWKNGLNTTIYQNGSGVIFDDSAVNATVSIANPVSPAYMIMNNANLNYVFNGVLNGSGYLIKSGTKSVTLNNNNSFSGGIVLNDGTLLANAASALGTGEVSFNGGILQLANNNLSFKNVLNLTGNTAITSGAVSGFKALNLDVTINGSGVLKIYNNSSNNMPLNTLTGGNYSGFTGTLIYEAGFINKGFAWTFSQALDLRNGTLVMQNTVNSVNALVLNFPGTSYVGKLTQTGINLTHLTLGSGAVLSVGNLAQNSTYPGVIDGTGSLVLTGGYLALSGENTYTGTTSINGGQLDIAGKLNGAGQVNVANGAILGGNGSIAGAGNISGKISLIDQGATALNFGGVLTLNDGSSIDMELSTPDGSDQIFVNGDINIPTNAAVTINLTALTGFASGSYTLIKNSSGINASGFILGTVPPGHHYELLTLGSNLVLNVTTPPIAPASLSAVAGANSALLTWPAAANATTYNVKRSLTVGGPYILSAHTIGTSFTDTLVDHGKTYHYVVSAENAAGESPNTMEVLATIPKLTQAITFNIINAKWPGDPDFMLSAIASSGLPVNYISSNTAVAQVIGNKIHISAAGQTNIYAIQPGDSTYSAADSVVRQLIVTPLNLSVAYANNDNGSPANNMIKPEIKIINTGANAVNYNELTVRYWFTPENYAGINTWLDYAQLGNNNIRLTYIDTLKPRIGALGCIQYAFEATAGSLPPGNESGPIRVHFANKDWADFDEADDYSYAASTSFLNNSKITIYRNGILVWGTEPAVVNPTTQISVAVQTINTNATTNAISNYVLIKNEGTLPVSYGDLTVRYWFTADGTSPLKYWVDYAKIGNANINGQFSSVTPASGDVDTYLQVGFNNVSSVLYPLSNSGNIQQRITKTNWSNFNQSNDYSFNTSSSFTLNPKITVYYKGSLIYGTEPGSSSNFNMMSIKEQGILGNSMSPLAGKNANVIFPNPLTSNTFNIKTVSDLYNQSVQTRIYDLRNGAVIYDKNLPCDSSGNIRVELNANLRSGIYSVQLNNLPVLKLMVGNP